MAENTAQYHGKCYCGGAGISVAGDPIVMASCHCHSCRKWHSAPVNAWCLWPADKVDFSGETIQSSVNDDSHRVSCATCGGAIANIKPRHNVVAVYAMSVAESGLTFRPAGHIFYAERVFDMADGLPKWVTIPEFLGGDGKTIAEPEKTGWLG